jgi:hypothetical protein
VVVAVAMVDDGVSHLDAGATVYETNYLGISCCTRTTDEIMSSFCWLFLVDCSTTVSFGFLLVAWCSWQGLLSRVLGSVLGVQGSSLGSS